MGSVSKHQLESLTNSLCSEPNTLYQYLPFISLINTVIQAMQASEKKFWDQFQSIEKVLMLSAEEDGPSSLLKRLVDIIQKCIPGETSKFQLHDILGFVIFCYSLVGSQGFSKRDEDLLCESLTQSILSSQEYLNVSTLQISQVTEILNLLQTIGQSRQHLSQYKNIFKLNSGGNWTYESLASQVAEHLASDTDLQDITRISSTASLGNLLKSGFGRLGFGLKPSNQPRNNTALIIFFIGGVTLQEVKEITERMNISTPVFIGSTNIANPAHILQSVIQNITKNK